MRFRLPMWMFYPDCKKALFLHIQKTAGSSIVDIARCYYRRKDIVSHGEYSRYKAEELKHVRFISGHFGYSYAKTLMESRYSFTFLRDPVERILSFYYYNRTRDIDEFPMTRIAHEMDLEQFLKEGMKNTLVKSRIWNNQTWQLAEGFGAIAGRGMENYGPEHLLDMALSHLGEFSYIGFLESFEDDQNIILSNLGIPIRKKTIHANATKGRLCTRDLSDSTLDLLAELTELDRELYQKAQLLREKILISGEMTK